MTPEQIKQQKREAMKKRRAEKKAQGFVGFACQIKPEWRKLLTAFIKQLEKYKG